MLSFKPSAVHTNRKGFSLLELAIVMGVIGLISGAIWIAAAKMRTNQRIQDAVLITNEIVANVRALYTGVRSPTALPTASIAVQVAANNLFPEAVVDRSGTPTTRNPWNGTIFIRFLSAPLRGFSVEYTLPTTMPHSDRKNVCLTMMTRLPGTAPEYAGAYANTVPTGAMPPNAQSSEMPALVFVYRTVGAGGAWVDVTGEAPANIFTAATQGCSGFAFYYDL